VAIGLKLKDFTLSYLLFLVKAKGAENCGMQIANCRIKARGIGEPGSEKGNAVCSVTITPD
jgi:hypothetical protein